MAAQSMSTPSPVTATPNTLRRRSEAGVGGRLVRSAATGETAAARRAGT
ncbi:hypothetical protein [Streptomyces sp. NPDC051776]